MSLPPHQQAIEPASHTPAWTKCGPDATPVKAQSPPEQDNDGHGGDNDVDGVNEKSISKDDDQDTNPHNVPTGDYGDIHHEPLFDAEDGDGDEDDQGANPSRPAHSANEVIYHATQPARSQPPARPYYQPLKTQRGFFINSCTADYRTGISSALSSTLAGPKQQSDGRLPTSSAASSLSPAYAFHTDSDAVRPLEEGEDLFEEDECGPVEAHRNGEDLVGYASQQKNYFLQPGVELTKGENSHESETVSGPVRKSSHDQNGHRLPSYLEDLEAGISPTESQLVKDDFQFHRGMQGLSQEGQIARFGRTSDMSVITKVEPSVPSKQQWYAFKRVHSAADGVPPEKYDEEEVDKIAKVIDNAHDCDCRGEPGNCSCPAGTCQCDVCGKQTTAKHKLCGCGGDAAKCGCPPGKCGCTGCGHDGNGGEDIENSDDESAPMDIGKTPITPTFPAIGGIPGLGAFVDAPQPGDGPKGGALVTIGERVSDYGSYSRPRDETGQAKNPGCGCICGDSCACPQGRCNCDAKQAPQSQTKQDYKGDRLSHKSIGWLIKKAAEDGKVDIYHPNHRNSPRKSGLPSLYETSSPLEPSRRPDTPRPFDESIRQSIEPEGLPPNWYRQSSPGYEDRSPSPSPVSYQSDVHMRDVTATPDRQDSLPASSQVITLQSATHQPRPVLPFSTYPGDYPSQLMPSQLSYLSAPRTAYVVEYDQSGRPSQSLSHLQQSIDPQLYQSPSLPGHPPVPADAPSTPRKSFSHTIPAPPIPSDTLNPVKVRRSNNSSRNKSVVNDSGISKPAAKSRAVSRKVTAKQPRQPKEKTVAQRKKDEGKVAAAVKKIEEKAMKEKEKREAQEKEDAEKKQEDGTPVRRSGRIRTTRLSGDLGAH